MSAALHCGGGIRLFIGERIEHASDREILVTVCDALNKGAEWAYIFANFNYKGFPQSQANKNPDAAHKATSSISNKYTPT